MAAPRHQGCEAVTSPRELTSSTSIAHRISKRPKTHANAARRGGGLRTRARQSGELQRARLDAHVLLHRLHRGVEEEKHLALSRRIEARHGEQPRLVGREADQLKSPRQRAMAGADMRQLRDLAIER